MSNETTNVANLTATIVDNADLGGPKELSKEQLAVQAIADHARDMEARYPGITSLVRAEALKLLNDPVLLPDLTRNMLIAGVNAIEYRNSHIRDLNRPVATVKYHEGAIQADLSLVDGQVTAELFYTSVDAAGEKVVGEALPVNESTAALKAFAESANWQEGINTIYIVSQRQIEELQDRAGRVLEHLKAQNK